MFALAELIGAREHVLLVRIDRVGRTAAGHLALAVAQTNRRGRARRIDAQPIHALAQNGKGQIRRVDLVSLAVVEATHMHEQSPRRQLHLGHMIRKIQECDGRVGGQAQQRTIQLQFDATALIRPDLVSGRERAIEWCSKPIIGTARLKRHRAVDIGQTRDARRRIVYVGAREHRHEQKKRQRADQRRSDRIDMKLGHRNSHLVIAHGTPLAADYRTEYAYDGASSRSNSFTGWR